MVMSSPDLIPMYDGEDPPYNIFKCLMHLKYIGNSKFNDFIFITRHGSKYNIPHGRLFNRNYQFVATHIADGYCFHIKRMLVRKEFKYSIEKITGHPTNIKIADVIIWSPVTKK